MFASSVHLYPNIFTESNKYSRVLKNSTTDICLHKVDYKSSFIVSLWEHLATSADLYIIPVTLENSSVIEIKDPDVMSCYSTSRECARVNKFALQKL